MSILILAALAVAPAAAPTPGPVKTFKDWTVACDNIRSCSAVALMPEEGAEDFLSLLLERTGDAAAPVLVEAFADQLPPKGAEVELVVDGTVVQSLGIGRGGSIAATLTPATLTKMANGERVEWRVTGKPAGSASLAGFSAAMRYWDVAQLRGGGATAVVARGAAVRNPVAPLPPQVAAARIAGPAAAALSTAATVALAKQFGCEDEQSESKPETHRLGPDRVLILLPCGAGAYNYSSRPIVATGAGQAVRYAAAQFDYLPRWAIDPGGATLINAEFSGTTATLSSDAKSRGIGDCGTSLQYVWDGTRFRLFEQNEMDECRGSTDWMRTWIATVRR